MRLQGDWATDAARGHGCGAACGRAAGDRRRRARGGGLLRERRGECSGARADRRATGAPRPVGDRREVGGCRVGAWPAVAAARQRQRLRHRVIGARAASAATATAAADGERARVGSAADSRRRRGGLDRRCGSASVDEPSTPDAAPRRPSPTGVGERRSASRGTGGRAAGDPAACTARCAAGCVSRSRSVRLGIGRSLVGRGAARRGPGRGATPSQHGPSVLPRSWVRRQRAAPARPAAGAVGGDSVHRSRPMREAVTCTTGSALSRARRSDWRARTMIDCRSPSVWYGTRLVGRRSDQRVPVDRLELHQLAGRPARQLRVRLLARTESELEVEAHRLLATAGQRAGSITLVRLPPEVGWLSVPSTTREVSARLEVPLRASLVPRRPRRRRPSVTAGLLPTADRRITALTRRAPADHASGPDLGAGAA